MNAARDNSVCLRLECWLSAYVDDELDVVHCAEVEDHLNRCEDCADRLEHLRATRNSMQAVLATPAPGALRDRMTQLLNEERAARGDVPITSEVRPVDEEAPISLPQAPMSLREAGVSVRPVENTAPAALSKLRLIVPLAAAATIALVFGAMELQKQGPEPISSASPYSVDSAMAAAKVASLDGLINELVLQHMVPPPLDTTDPEQLNKYERHVGFRVREPHLREAKWMGARVQPTSRAAMMRFMLRNNHPITLYVFDSNRVKMESRQLAQQHRAADKVFVGNVRGYTVAAAARDGVGYAVASDLSGDETAKLLVAAAR